MAARESELRQILRDESRFDPLAVSFCEFGLGGDPGLPDTWFAFNNRWNAFELKRGKGVAKQLRPSQIRWHKGSLRFGIRTFGMTISADAQMVDVIEIIRPGRSLADNLLAKVPASELNYSIIIELCG